MADGRCALLWLLPVLAGAASVACRSSAARVDQAAWRTADARWKRGDPGAFAAWRALDPHELYGRAAHVRLRVADLGYRRAVEVLRFEQPGLRETLADALGLAPMDPALYLAFARACRERGALVKAVDFYRKFLERNGMSPAWQAAQAELRELEPKVIDVPEIGDGDGGNAPPAAGRRAWLPPGLALGGAALLALALVVRVARRRGERSLRDMLRERPEIHQDVAYQVGCLRHEFLKHRVGAAGEALAAWVDGHASAEQQRFAEERLCRGEPLLVAWRAHLRGLERILGLSRRLARVDPLFRTAERALCVLGRAASAGRPGDGERVRRARETLQRFDRELGELLAGLAYCPLDTTFLREVMAATRAEWSSGKVELDEITVGPVPDGVAVDVYRTDLGIVLKNILRNAIAALADSARPRRLAVDAAVELEATGEEVVRIRVRDSSLTRLAPLPPVAPTGVGHGLGIVQIALQRYDGSLEVMSAGDGYAKAVVVRLFRSQTPPHGLGAAA